MGLRNQQMGMDRRRRKGSKKPSEIRGFSLLHEFLRIAPKFLRRCTIWNNNR
jgi:hypothetical protein